MGTSIVDVEAEALWTTFRFFCAKISFDLPRAPATRFLVCTQDH